MKITGHLILNSHSKWPFLVKERQHTQYIFCTIFIPPSQFPFFYHFLFFPFFANFFDDLIIFQVWHFWVELPAASDWLRICILPRRVVPVTDDMLSCPKFLCRTSRPDHSSRTALGLWLSLAWKTCRLADCYQSWTAALRGVAGLPVQHAHFSHPNLLGIWKIKHFWIPQNFNSQTKQFWIFTV